MNLTGRFFGGTAWRGIVAGVVLAFQAASIVYARFDDARYFCWAPHDAQNEYVIAVEIDGRSLSPSEVEARYRIPASGVDPRSIAHVTRLVQQYERTLGADDDATVVVGYRINGKALRRWRPAR